MFFEKSSIRGLVLNVFKVLNLSNLFFGAFLCA